MRPVRGVAKHSGQSAFRSRARIFARRTRPLSKLTTVKLLASANATIQASVHTFGFVPVAEVCVRHNLTASSGSAAMRAPVS